MGENSIKSIRNGIVISVVAGVILLAVPKLRVYVASLFSWLWSGVIWCWNALIVSYALPGWVWLLVFLFALIGLINIYLAIKGDAEEPEYEKYVEGFMYGVIWRWSWVGSNIFNIWCFCPTCDATLVYDDSSCRSFYSDIKKTDFICENCGNRVVASISGGNKDYAISAVRREVNRRIRTDEFKRH